MLDGRIKRLLASPKAWTQKAYARNAGGRQVNPESKEACSFCLLGAVEHAYSIDERREVNEAIQDAIRKQTGKPFMPTESFNDWCHTTHAEVVAVLERSGA